MSGIQPVIAFSAGRHPTIAQGTGKSFLLQPASSPSQQRSSENDPFRANLIASPHLATASPPELRREPSTVVPLSADGMFEISADRLASIRAQIQKGAKEAAKHYPVSIHTQTDDDGAANAQMLERKVDILERELEQLRESIAAADARAVERVRVDTQRAIDAAVAARDAELAKVQAAGVISEKRIADLEKRIVEINQSAEKAADAASNRHRVELEAQKKEAAQVLAKTHAELLQWRSRADEFELRAAALSRKAGALSASSLAVAIVRSDSQANAAKLEDGETPEEIALKSMTDRLRDAELHELRMRVTVQEATLALQRTELADSEVLISEGRRSRTVIAECTAKIQKLEGDLHMTRQELDITRMMMTDYHGRARVAEVEQSQLAGQTRMLMDQLDRNAASVRPSRPGERFSDSYALSSSSQAISGSQSAGLSSASAGGNAATVTGKGNAAAASGGSRASLNKSQSSIKQPGASNVAAGDNTAAASKASLSPKSAKGSGKRDATPSAPTDTATSITKSGSSTDLSRAASSSKLNSAATPGKVAAQEKGKLSRGPSRVSFGGKKDKSTVNLLDNVADGSPPPVSKAVEIMKVVLAGESEPASDVGQSVQSPSLPPLPILRTPSIPLTMNQTQAVQPPIVDPSSAVATAPSAPVATPTVLAVAKQPAPVQNVEPPVQIVPVPEKAPVVATNTLPSIAEPIALAPAEVPEPVHVELPSIADSSELDTIEEDESVDDSPTSQNDESAAPSDAAVVAPTIVPKPPSPVPALIADTAPSTVIDAVPVVIASATATSDADSPVDSTTAQPTAPILKRTPTNTAASRRASLPAASAGPLVLRGRKSSVVVGAKEAKAALAASALRPVHVPQVAGFDMVLEEDEQADEEEPQESVSGSPIKSVAKPRVNTWTHEDATEFEYTDDNPEDSDARIARWLEESRAVNALLRTSTPAYDAAAVAVRRAEARCVKLERARLRELARIKALQAEFANEIGVRDALLQRAEAEVSYLARENANLLLDGFGGRAALTSVEEPVKSRTVQLKAWAPTEAPSRVSIGTIFDDGKADGRGTSFGGDAMGFTNAWRQYTGSWDSHDQPLGSHLVPLDAQGRAPETESGVYSHLVKSKGASAPVLASPRRPLTSGSKAPQSQLQKQMLPPQAAMTPRAMPPAHTNPHTGPHSMRGWGEHQRSPSAAAISTLWSNDEIAPLSARSITAAGHRAPNTAAESGPLAQARTASALELAQRVSTRRLRVSIAVNAKGPVGPDQTGQVDIVALQRLANREADDARAQEIIRAAEDADDAHRAHVARVAAVAAAAEGGALMTNAAIDTAVANVRRDAGLNIGEDLDVDDQTIARNQRIWNAATSNSGELDSLFGSMPPSTLKRAPTLRREASHGAPPRSTPSPAQPQQQVPSRGPSRAGLALDLTRVQASSPVEETERASSSARGRYGRGTLLLSKDRLNATRASAEAGEAPVPTSGDLSVRPRPPIAPRPSAISNETLRTQMQRGVWEK